MRKYGLSFICVIYILFLWSCANQTTPSGGPKDETPPKLLNSNPKPKQKNFKGKVIELEFDEYVNLNNPREEILISPSLAKKPQFKVRKNKVTIEPEEPLEDSTTYTISLREGVRDITENNPTENLKLAFSTGPLIDSLIIKGRVKQVLTEKIPEKITVAIYQSDTFNIFNHTPNYFTVTNKEGAFSLENIKSGTYHIYAFADKNKNLKVESRSELFGFLKDSIVLNGPTDSLTIPMINLDTSPLKMNNFRNNGLITTIKFNKSITEYKLTYDYPSHLIQSFGSDQTEIALYTPENITDSLRLEVFAIDSLEMQIDTTLYIKKYEGKYIPGDFKITTDVAKYNLDNGSLQQKFKLTKPLHQINLDSIFIQTDSTSTISFNHGDFSYDSIHKELEILKPIPRDSLFRTKDFKPELVMGSGFLISVESDSSKGKRQVLRSVKPDETGVLLIEVKTQEPHYIIQLFASSGELVREVKDIKSYSFKNLEPQNYRIRVLIDRNNNGKWDPGNIYKNEEPERTYFYINPEKKYDFPIRANWELGPLMLIF